MGRKKRKSLVRMSEVTISTEQRKCGVCEEVIEKHGMFVWYMNRSCHLVCVSTALKDRAERAERLLLQISEAAEKEDLRSQYAYAYRYKLNRVKEKCTECGKPIKSDQPSFVRNAEVLHLACLLRKIEEKRDKYNTSIAEMEEAAKLTLQRLEDSLRLARESVRSLLGD